MSYDSDASLLGLRGDVRRLVSRWKPSRTTLKYGLVVATFLGLYAGIFLSYVWWDLSEWLADLTGLCLLVVLLLSVSTLFRRRWREFAIFSAALIIAFLPALGVSGHVDWLYAVGFRIHASR